MNYNNSAVTSGTAVNVSGTSAEFTVGNSGTATNGQIRITAIEVIYTIGNSTTYYWSAPVAAAVERPVIDVPETFTFSTIATISCDTEDASIKYSFDNETWSDYSEPLTITETTTIYAKGVKGTEESVVVSKSTTKQLATPTVTINATGITNTNVYDGTDAGTLAATVAYNDNAIADAIVTWSGNNNEVATIDAETGIVTLVAAGTVTFTATYVGNSDYAQATATYEMTVTNTDPNAPGTQNNPYTVAQARAAIDAGAGVTSVYATGIVSEIVTAYNSQYGNISYNISTDGTTTADQLQAYRGKSYNGENFTSADDIQVGDVVVIHGNLKKYNETYEFDANSRLVSLDRPVIPVISANNVELAYDATSGEIAYTIINPVDGEVLTATCTADWISNITVDTEKVTFTTTANEGDEDRTATFTLSYEGATDKPVTVTQKHFVADYATLPFEYDGNGTGDLPQGFTVSGLGTYNSSPAMKFDGTGDYAILKFNERPGVLTFDIKGNSFSGGTFKVQTSVDGTTFTDLESYTELGETKSESFDNLAADVRYIKWIYTEKVSGNVALGNINLEAAASTATITLNAACTDGTLIYGTYYSDKAYVMNGMLEGQVVSVDANGKLAVQTAYEGGEVVPAYTALLIATADEFTGTKEYTITLSTGGDDWSEFNMLKGTLTADEMTTGDNCLFYRLTMHNGTQIGFWWGADYGGAFKPGANKAYLAVPATQAKDGFAFGNDGDATEIVLNALKGEQNGEMYNLQGQKVGSEYKGIVIVNGKKFINK